VGGVDPEIVEAACLAHDLGHPPFGHIAEDKLSELAKGNNVDDGFEGNAQSFRIVTKLSVRKESPTGLDLTRASLNAILKYPWHHDADEHPKKFGAYRTEKDDFAWARELLGADNRKSAEAELMDFADDIAYSVHDMADFYQAGRIPLDRLLSDDKERSRFLDGSFKRLEIKDAAQRKALEDAFNPLMGFSRNLCSLQFASPTRGPSSSAEDFER
jgi:dGTPase